MKVHIFLLLSLSINLSTTFAQTLVDSTCRRYFEITNKLSKDDTLNREVWNNLMNDESIQMYIRDQGVDKDYLERYRRTMQIVYMPKNDSLLRNRIKDPNKYWLTYILYQYKVNESKMKAYLSNLEKNPDKYFNDCYKYTYSVLPKNAQKKALKQIYSIIPIHYDAHAENNLIICSLLCAYLNDKNHYGVLGGHEFHHILRPRIDYNKITAEDENAVALMEVTLNEGSADMIDKKYMTKNDTILLPFQRYYNTFFDEGKFLLPQIDSLLQLSARGSKFTVRQFLKGTVFTGGHVPGTYMAHYIEKNGMKSKLISRIQDPFYFYILYNEAARRDSSKPFVFSKATMQYIVKLRKKYFGKLV